MYHTRMLTVQVIHHLQEYTNNQYDISILLTISMTLVFRDDCFIVLNFSLVPVVILSMGDLEITLINKDYISVKRCLVYEFILNHTFVAVVHKWYFIIEFFLTKLQWLRFTCNLVLNCIESLLQ